MPRFVAGDDGVAKAQVAELKEAAKEAGVGDRLAKVLGGRRVLPRFLGSVMAGAPFLRGLMLGDPERLCDFLADDPDRVFKNRMTALARCWQKADEETLMATLRRARQDVALLAALADLGGVWDVVRVTAALTEFADAAVGAAVRFILREAHADGLLTVPDPAKPNEASGWVILGMGKFGAGELNYSSDIDLIVLFDLDIVRVPEDREALQVFIRLTKRLVQFLQEHTGDGYVFRTDLRLRPDPSATNIVMSTEAALQYYESLGQNWERAALIKARPVAGDIAAGEAFLAELGPFIWRKYLDYAAIADIHSIKRQIHDHRGHAEIAVAGHNIKLGRGGIREIEFFVQTQQLIAGGRNPELRGRRTLDMLTKLAELGWIDDETAHALSAAYVELRKVEHCLQMIDDAQTHALPIDLDGLTLIAHMAGYADEPSFARALLETLRKVRDDYSGLFETAPSLTSRLGNLVFTGDSDDPETLATLAGLGFSDPATVSRTIRGWHFGRYPATRSATARERLTECVPAILETIASATNADAAFIAFDRFLSRLPAGLQFFSLLTSNPGLLGLLVTIMATAPRLAETIVRRAHVLDALIEPAFFGTVPERKVVEGRLGMTLADALSYEDALDRARIFKQEQSFLIGARVLAGTIGARDAGTAYADLADITVAALLDAARTEFEAAYGKIARGQIAVIAMGKLGGREMTAASDLDLIVLYDFSEKASGSNGPRPLGGVQYFTRLTQRLLAALTAPTAEGALYEVDLRLRPSGKSGPLASHIDGFAGYQAKDAWTWEHMALTRARPIAGDKALVARARKEIAAAVNRPRKARKILADVLEMRGMVEAEKGGGGAWDLKQVPGGLVDIEFIAQALQLVHAADHPELISTETEAILLAAAKAGLLAPGEADILLPALRLYQALTQLLRLCVDGIFKPDDAPRGLLELLARAGELPDFADARCPSARDRDRGSRILRAPDRQDAVEGGTRLRLRWQWARNARWPPVRSADARKPPCRFLRARRSASARHAARRARR